MNLNLLSRSMIAERHEAWDEVRYPRGPRCSSRRTWPVGRALRQASSEASPAVRPW